MAAKKPIATWDRHKHIKDGDLTGKSRYRVSFFGKFILQLEYCIVTQQKQTAGRFHPHPPRFQGTKWRDATRNDMKIDPSLKDAILAGIAGQLNN